MADSSTWLDLASFSSYSLGYKHYNSLPGFCNKSSTRLRSSRVTISTELTVWPSFCMMSKHENGSRGISLKKDCRMIADFSRKRSAKSIGCACGKSTSTKKFGLFGGVGMWFLNFNPLHLNLILFNLNFILDPSFD